MEYGDRRHIPWGVSEVRVPVTDRAGTYQYRAFGVPGLGPQARARRRSRHRAVRHGAGEPGGSEPRRGQPRALARAGAEGRFGFYESIDYSAATRSVHATERQRRRPRGRRLVRAFFSHHQGMSLVALANVVCHDVFVRRFHADPRVQATELLLQERVPREAIVSEPRPAEGARPMHAVGAGVGRATLPVAAHREPAHAFPVERPLHDGRDARGRRVQHVARPRGDTPARGPDLGRGRALHLSARSLVGRRVVADLPADRSASRTSTTSRSSSTRRRSAGATATSRPSCRSRCRRKTTSRSAGCRSPTTAIGRARSRSRATPKSSSARPEDDLAHPAFGKLFVETEHDAQNAGLLFSRRPRARGRASRLGIPRAWRGWPARRRGRMGDRSRAVHRPRPIAGQSRSRSTGARCRATTGPCWIRWPRCAIASGWRPARSCA